MVIGCGSGGKRVTAKQIAGPITGESVATLGERMHRTRADSNQNQISRNVKSEEIEAV
jgi:hypothetical protein